MDEKLIKNKEIKVEMLYGLNTYSIRSLGRAVGVKSPTSKPKHQIIKEIQLILEGKLEPHTTTKGRPHKQDSINDIVEIFAKQFTSSDIVIRNNSVELEKSKKEKVHVIHKLNKLIDAIKAIIDYIQATI